MKLYTAEEVKKILEHIPATTIHRKTGISIQTILKFKKGGRVNPSILAAFMPFMDYLKATLSGAKDE